MAQPFYVDGMTVEQILSLDQTVLNSLNKRDMSHALKIVALAANKRLSRLQARATKNKEGKYISTGEKAIAPDALNYLADSKRGVKRFGASGKSLNKMRQEMKEARIFMSLKTSTVKGATAVLKGREKRIMGTTANQAVKKDTAKFIRDWQKTHKGKMPSERTIKRYQSGVRKTFEQAVSDAWQTYRDFLKEQGKPNSPYVPFKDSLSIIKMIGQRTKKGMDSEDVLKAANDMYEQNYIADQQAAEDEIDNDDDWFDDWNNDEEY